MKEKKNLSLEETIWLKCCLLTEGCDIAKDITFPSSIHCKQIHLYAHSNEKFTSNIPDDIFIGEGKNRVICRIRYNHSSSFCIVEKDQHFFLYDQKEKMYTPISFVEKTKYHQIFVQEKPLSSICSFLGNDLLGIIPSNYCFYFKNNKQCRFCEIVPTYKKEVKHRGALKNVSLICEACMKAIHTDKRCKYLVFTTGNIISYDATFDYIYAIIERLQNRDTSSIKQILAALMPPDSFSLIKKLSQTLLNKISFPIEVFDHDHFLQVCPGKGNFGYKRILHGLEYALSCFGKGNTYSNLVYGIQSLNSHLDPNSFDPEKENDKSLTAVESLLSMGIVPTFTLYHYGGYNQIGQIKMNTKKVFSFFRKWGEKVFQSQLIDQKESSVLFSSYSLSNTLFNDTFRLAILNSRN